ncbi:deoxyribodipyrimidine photo-lyase [Glaciimonas sp. Gout2]|uniref:cryptochrome/photolyase family protein n=1 Tax=unclassified Glaciimonas TaxID=2644401 RepID=UPI002B22231C|nr:MULTISPECIES: deoxyribodipyrimidine photo-lyase [unclassified Glaciimonas]MEB0013405.1 deoxyribodipyrimidine photo-lyase [Glaciimonas sp. Cout2]MEB0082684.1 deoxyribodipyrimidine photo-lyase [Glaciimonas sp. Gout2]
MPQFDKSLVWFRRDLRVFDNAALHHALKNSRAVFCVFVFDTDILQPLREAGLTADRRVEFIHASIMALDTALRELGGGLIVRHGSALPEISSLASELDVNAVFTNRDYEPQAVTRDNAVKATLAKNGCIWHSYKDQVIFETDEILSLSAKPFSVFTPYKNAWMKRLAAADGEFFLKPYPISSYASRLATIPPENAVPIPSLSELGFTQTNLSELKIPTGIAGAEELLEDFMPRIGGYDTTRNFPAVKGPSYLSVHLRFGTISIRTLARNAYQAMRQGIEGSGASVWLSELVWRDFYFMILHHHPHVAQRAFKPDYDAIQWETGAPAEAAFQAWCDGRTGYPLVDAAMLQINQTGYMHNRLRMVVASFLIKDLGIDWRWGEAYFAAQLNDFDLSANNGGWQWAASSGCDAQPYFRIFNPITQSEKFDSEGKFIRRYLPQLAKLSNKAIHAPWLADADTLADAGIKLGVDYPRPLIQHDEARKQTLARYAVVKKVTEE